MHRKPIISIVLGTYNRLKFIKLTIESIRKEMNNINHEIIVIDGGSTDGTLAWLVEQKDIIVIIQHNRGQWNGNEIERKSWGYFMNLGFKCAKGKYICMLSDDCLVVPGAINNGYLYFEKMIQSGRKIGSLAFYWRDWPLDKHYKVGLTLGDKMFVNHGIYLKKALEEVDYIDEDTYHFYHADGDLCLKMWEKGYECIASEDSYIEHYAHANVQVRKTNYIKQQEDWNNYLNKWMYQFYDPIKKDRGRWIYKENNDINNNIQAFVEIRQEQKKKCLDRIKKEISSISRDKKVVIYGAGQHTKKLLNHTLLKYKNIQYIVDRNEKQSFKQYTIKEPKYIINNLPDVIVISSFKYQKDIYEYLANVLHYNGDIITLYNENDIEPFYIG